MPRPNAQKTGNPGQPPLFTANVFGTGTVTGTYRLTTIGNDPTYLNNCCTTITIAP